MLTNANNQEYFYLPNPQKGNRKEYLKLHIWFFVQKYLVRTSPKCCTRWRICLLRLFGAKIGPHCYIASTAFIKWPWRLRMGESSSVDESCVLQGDIVIGSRVSIAHHVHVVTSGHNVRSRYFELYIKPVKIENSVFIGCDVYIGGDVTIGQFSVIGAKSVVWHNVPENSIAFGNPCTVKTSRLPQEEYKQYLY
jgi:putative colanic acid biosynthesis acetyltransferase WcaF